MAGKRQRQHVTDAIQPFHRVAASAEEGRPSRFVLSLMRLHFLLAWLALLLGAAALALVIYPDLARTDLLPGLRLSGTDDLYARSTQLMLAALAALALLSLVPLGALRELARGAGSLALARATALLLLAGIPAGIVLWLYLDRIPARRAEMTTAQQLIADVGWAVRLVAALLIVQALLALGYQFWLTAQRAYWRARGEAASFHAPLGVVRGPAILLWVLLLAGLALALGVATDWLFEIPVRQAEPGALLYATTFDAYNDEWDTFPGRDAAMVEPRSATPLGADDPAARLSGPVMVLSYGAGVPDEVIWSTLDRKFADFDLRVTTQQLAGPLDQNQYGVAFRYRGAGNFYLFQISSDGYYTLKKVRGGVQERVSDWGFSDAIGQGEAANEVRVVARRDEFRFFVNDAPVPLCLRGENRTSMWAAPGECFTDVLRWVYRDASFGQGRVALAVGTIDGSDIAVAFDDVLIVGPQPDVMQAEAE